MTRTLRPVLSRTPNATLTRDFASHEPSIARRLDHALTPFDGERGSDAI